MSGEVEKDFQEIQIRMASLMTGMGEPVLKLLDPKPGERILDMGCGLGVLAEEMVKMGCEVVAIDVNSQAGRGNTAAQCGCTADECGGDDVQG